MDTFFLLSMGAMAGMFAGLLGIGGGIIIVPVLSIVFTSQGVSIDVLMHLSIGTSLATIVITSISSIRAHHKHQAIDWPVVKLMAIGVFIGGILGSVIAQFIPGEELKTIFSIFIFLIAVQMFVGNTAKPHRTLPKMPGMILTGTGIGIISALMGVGGGSMSVPFLTWCNMSIRRAVATSSAIGFPIAVSGTIGFIFMGWSVAERPELSIGYVSLPAFFSIAVASLLFAPLGAWVAHRISPVILKKIFAVFLLVVGIKMLSL